MLDFHKHSHVCTETQKTQPSEKHEDHEILYAESYVGGA